MYCKLYVSRNIPQNEQNMQGNIQSDEYQLLKYIWQNPIRSHIHINFRIRKHITILSHVCHAFINKLERQCQICTSVFFVVWPWVHLETTYNRVLAYANRSVGYYNSWFNQIVVFWAVVCFLGVVVLTIEECMQSVPITTNIVSFNPAQARCTRYNNML